MHQKSHFFGFSKCLWYPDGFFGCFQDHFEQFRDRKRAMDLEHGGGGLPNFRCLCCVLVFGRHGWHLFISHIAIEPNGLKSQHSFSCLKSMSLNGRPLLWNLASLPEANMGR